ncbi:MAG: hypothetical protein AB7W59_30945 [Acidimicrobiia bacterium]
MSGVHNLKQQLEQLGRQPVEPARPEFRAALLARILESDRGAAAPAGPELRVIDGEASDGARGQVALARSAPPGRSGGSGDELARRRRSRVLAQAAAAVSIAAAAAGVLGVVSLVDDGAPVGTAGATGTEAQLASGEGLTEVVITPSGDLVDRNGDPAGMNDGPAKMTCDDAPTSSTMVFYDTSEQGYECPAGEEVQVQVVDDAIVAADAPTTDLRHIELELYKPVHVPGSSQPLTWSWERYSGRRFDHYELRRYPDGGDAAQAELVAVLDDVNQTTYRESSVPTSNSVYYVAVIAPDGSESGRSGEYRVTIKQAS